MEAALDAAAHHRPDVQQLRAHLGLGRPGALVGHHQLEHLESVLPAQPQQLRPGAERIRRRGVRVRLARLRFVAAHDEAAADRVVVLLAQHARPGAERGEAHAVGVTRQPLVMHEQQLHRLIEGDLVLAEQPDASAWCGCAARSARCCPDRRSRAARPRGPRARRGRCRGPAPVSASEPYRRTAISLGARQQPVALQAEDELARRPHRPHGVRAGGSDADLENVKDAQGHATNLWRIPRARPAQPNPGRSPPAA